MRRQNICNSNHSNNPQIFNLKIKIVNSDKTTKTIQNTILLANLFWIYFKRTNPKIYFFPFLYFLFYRNFSSFSRKWKEENFPRHYFAALTLSLFFLFFFTSAGLYIAAPSTLFLTKTFSSNLKNKVRRCSIP